MPRTPANFGGPFIETEYEIYDNYGSMPNESGVFVYFDGYFYLKDAYGAFNVRQISYEKHKALRDLIHFVSDGPGDGFASGAYREIIGTAFPTNIIWWESNTKLKKIVERQCIWSGVKLTTDKWKVYGADGVTVLATLTDTISYAGVFENARTRVVT